MCKYSFKILVKNKGSGDFVCLCVYTDIHLSSLFVEKPITYPLDFGVFSHNQSSNYVFVDLFLESTLIILKLWSMDHWNPKEAFRKTVDESTG
jgi:hypothetical protein